MKLYIKLSMTLCCLFLAVSCQTVKRARHLQKDENRRAGERTVTAAELGITSETVLSLKELEDIAVRYAPATIRAQQAMAAARIAVKDAGADHLPSITANAGHSRSTKNNSPHNQ